jgi:predicted nuclease of predicted toxin-antitoxin system
MKILIDMNLSPTWVEEFAKADINSVHWSQVGLPNAPDKEIFDYASENDFVVFTNDLDFGTLLALNKTNCPSVIQVRTQDVTPQNLFHTINSTLTKYSEFIKQGALITIDESKSRIRILPIK